MGPWSLNTQPNNCFRWVVTAYAPQFWTNSYSPLILKPKRKWKLQWNLHFVYIFGSLILKAYLEVVGRNGMQEMFWQRTWRALSNFETATIAVSSCNHGINESDMKIRECTGQPSHSRPCNVLKQLPMKLRLVIQCKLAKLGHQAVCCFYIPKICLPSNLVWHRHVGLGD